MTDELVKSGERPAKIQVASTFYDLATAESEIARVLADNDIEVRNWLAGRGGQLTLLGRAGRVVGMLITGPDARPEGGRGIKVVLRRNARRTLDYHIHTVMVMR